MAGDAPASTDQIAANAVATLSNFNRAANESVANSTPLTAADVRAVYKWQYFPHFDTQTVSPSVFTDLEQLQGNRATFFTSSVRTFEIVELVIDSAYDIVDRFF